MASFSGAQEEVVVRSKPVLKHSLFPKWFCIVPGLVNMQFFPCCRSAFMFYSLELRPEVKAQNPDFGVGKLAQQLAARWKVMNPSEKHPYELMARKDKERYEQELKAYKKGLYTGSGMTPRQVAHSVTGRTIPPPASANHREARRLNSLSALSTVAPPTPSTPVLGLVVEEEKPNVLISPSDDEDSPPSGDELDQLCEFYQ